MKPHYSGPKSTKFWKRVNALKDPGLALYGRGCELQNLEGEVLEELKDAEAASKQKEKP